MSDCRGEPIAAYRNEAGVRVEVFDESRPYAYANIFHVMLRIVARFPGEEEPYERVLERMGTYEEDLSRVKQDMLANFEASALPYLFRADFPRRLSDHRAREDRKVLHFPGIR